MISLKDLIEDFVNNEVRVICKTKEEAQFFADALYEIRPDKSRWVGINGNLKDDIKWEEHGKFTYYVISNNGWSNGVRFGDYKEKIKNNYGGRKLRLEDFVMFSDYLSHPCGRKKVFIA